MSKKIRESKVESYLKDQIKELGGLAYKFTSTVNGVPDQIIIIDGHTYFVEVKRPNEKPRPNQIYTHEQIEKRGVPVYTVDSYKAIDQFIKQTLKKQPQKLTNKEVSIKDMIIKSKDSFKTK